MGGVISALRESLWSGSQPHSSRPPCNGAMEHIEITGEVKFSGGPAPDVLPANSHLSVRFEDVGRMVTASVKLGESIVDVTNIYEKGKPLMYSITCIKPWFVDRYGVSVVLNMGWKPYDKNWIRKGDYFSDTTHRVQLDDGKDSYKVDMEVVKY